MRNRKANELDVTASAISTAKFSKHGDTLVAEMSALGRVPTCRFYNDACDSGIALCSHLTGTVVRFVESGRDERDGEVMGWRFDVLDSDIEIARSVRHVLIIND